jgi:hypothetical protein
MVLVPFVGQPKDWHANVPHADGYDFSQALAWIWSNSPPFDCVASKADFPAWRAIGSQFEIELACLHSLEEKTMDHPTFAQLLGNYGEFLGAIAVAVTLIYLAGQLRQNTRALRSTSYAHWNEIASTWSDFLAEHAEELSEIEEKVDLDELSLEQQKIYLAFALKSYTQAETGYLLHRAGTLDEEFFVARMDQFEEFLNRTPLMRQAFQLVAPLTDSFTQFLRGRGLI